MQDSRGHQETIYKVARRQSKKKPKRDTSNWRPAVKAKKRTRDDTREAKLFGKALEEIRLSKQLTENGLAKLLGTSRSQISRMRGRDTEPRLSTARRYAKALSVPLYRFWSGKPANLGTLTADQQRFLDMFILLSPKYQRNLEHQLQLLMREQREGLGL